MEPVVYSDAWIPVQRRPTTRADDDQQEKEKWTARKKVSLTASRQTLGRRLKVRRIPAFLL